MSGSTLYAQTVTGTVSDATGPLPQATVMVKGTTTSTVTDLDGRYTIDNVDTNAVLVYSFMGFWSQEVAVNGRTEINVVLQEDSQQLSEVVVTGYVGQSKRSITGAVSQVNLNNLEKTRIPDVAQALQGQVAGVFVAANTGAPGDGSVIRIRGEGTIGDNRVLYVVDGTPTRDITFLNQADIESMTVLKDASATAIYGSRAAGGVVIITTKLGAKGKSSFDVDFFTGIHYVQNLPDMLNAEQYMNVMEQSWNNTYTTPNLYTSDRTTLNLADTDWLDELFTQGISRNVQITASGANDKTSYLISGGYYGMDGVVTEDNDQYKRVNFRTNVNSKLNEMFTAGVNMQITFQSQDRISSSGDAPGVIRHALIRPPVLGVYKDPSDPTYSVRNPYTDLPFYTGPVRDVGYLTRYEFSSNPLAIVHFTDDVRETFQAFGNTFLEGAFLDKALKVRTNLGMDVRFFHNKAFYENYGDDNISNPDDPLFGLGLGRNNRPNSLSESRAQDVTFTLSNTVNYIKTLGDVHDVNLLVGHEFIKNRFSEIVGARSGFDNDTDAFRYLGYGGNRTDGELYTPPSNGSDDKSWTLLSFFGSVNYGFDSRYNVTATVRADASSRFGPNNKWGYFPSFGANWIATNEKFMENVTWLSNLKLRASWGQSGNQEIPDGAYLTFVQTNTPLGTQVIRYGNPDLKWETTTQTNVGLDFGFFDNKLNFSADYFRKETEDILLSIRLPRLSVGVIEETYVNAGSVVNKGFEFGLNFQNNDNEFKYGVNANLATLDNEVTKLHGNVPLIEDDGGRTRSITGQPLNAFFGQQFDGIYQNQAEIDAHLYSNANGAVPGDIRFKDINGDGEINDDDRTYIGNPVPKITYGLSLNASYKNFDISLLFQGVEDVDRYNDQKQILDYDGRPFNSTTAVLGSWSGEGTSNTMPRLTFEDTARGARYYSVFVEDASYLRLKNIEIGYTFNKSLPYIDYLRVYASGQNLLTWTDYTGLDPESTNRVDQGTYPQTAAVMFGAKIKL